jgi:hypothetical protein
MSIYRRNDETVPTITRLTTKPLPVKEIYLEEVEEDLRSILAFDDLTRFVTGKYEEPEMLRLEVATRL